MGDVGSGHCFRKHHLDQFTVNCVQWNCAHGSDDSDAIELWALNPPPPNCCHLGEYNNEDKNVSKYDIVHFGHG